MSMDGKLEIAREDEKRGNGQERGAGALGVNPQENLETQEIC